MKSPCSTCDFAGEDKNCDQCKNCQLRVDYVRGIGTFPDTKVPTDEAQEPDKKPVAPADKSAYRPCSVPGCSRKHLAKGLCDVHYAKQRDKKKRMDIFKGPSPQAQPVAAASTLRPPPVKIQHQSRQLVLDMTNVPGAEEIIAEVRAQGEKDFRPVEYHAVYLLKLALLALSGDSDDIAPVSVETSAEDAA